jgi:hypothetical protein
MDQKTKFGFLNVSYKIPRKPDKTNISHKIPRKPDKTDIKHKIPRKPDKTNAKDIKIECCIQSVKFIT